MGAFFMLSYLALYWRMANRFNAWPAWALAALMAWALAMHSLTGSRTSMITALFGFLVWFAFQRKPLRLLVLSTLAALGLMLIAVFQPPTFYRETDGGMTGLTGRPEIWSAAVTLAAERPLQGYGYEVGGKIFEDPRFQNSELGLWRGSARVSLHNGYLSTLTGLGVPGFLILYTALLLPFWRSRSITDGAQCKPFLYGILAMCLIANLTESLIGSPAAITSVVLWMLSVVAGRLSSRRAISPGGAVMGGLKVCLPTRE
jgi:O-antigen ligase